MNDWLRWHGVVRDPALRRISGKAPGGVRRPTPTGKSRIRDPTRAYCLPDDTPLNESHNLYRREPVVTLPSGTKRPEDTEGGSRGPVLTVPVKLPPFLVPVAFWQIRDSFESSHRRSITKEDPMKHTRFAALFTAVAIAFATTAAFVKSMFETILEVVALPNRMRFQIEDGFMPFVPSGAPLDAALQHDLRHEAGIPKRAAPRNC